MSSDDNNVVIGPFITKLDIDPDRILDSMKGELQHVVITGYDKDGAEVFASSIANGPDVAWLLQRHLKALLAVVDDDA